MTNFQVELPQILNHGRILQAIDVQPRRFSASVAFHPTTSNPMVMYSPVQLTDNHNGCTLQAKAVQTSESHAPAQPSECHASAQRELTKQNLRRRKQRERTKLHQMPSKNAEFSQNTPSDMIEAAQTQSSCQENHKSADAATLVKQLAVHDLQAAWKTLQKEFSVQVLIWQSQRCCNSCADWVSVLEVPSSKEQALRSQLERALKLKSTRAIQSVLKESEHRGDFLNTATWDACKRVLEEDYLCELRWGLALDLNNALHHTDMQVVVDAVHVNTLIDECNIGNASVKSKVKATLGLPERQTPQGYSTKTWGPRRADRMQSNKGTAVPLNGGTFETGNVLQHDIHWCVKNTFVDVESDSEHCSTASTSSRRSLSSPAPSSRG